MSLPADSICVLAVDLGSSGPKATLFTDRGQLLTKTQAHVPTIFTADGGGEQDPEAWWHAVDCCIRQIVDARHVSPEAIAAISIASQWSVTVPVDRQGRHLMNAVHWTDSRGAPHTKRITDGLIKVSGYGLRRMLRWVRLTGGVPTHSGADALAHILFIRHERPDVYERTWKFLEPMDYLNLRLTGRAVASYATVFPYLLTDNRDNTHVTYADELIQRCGLDRDKLPDLLPVGTVLGPLRDDVAASLGLVALNAGRSAARPTAKPPRSAPARWPTMRRMRASALPVGSAATCRSRRPTCSTTWPPCPRPSMDATWSPPSKALPANAWKSSSTTGCARPTPCKPSSVLPTSTIGSSAWPPAFRPAATACCSCPGSTVLVRPAATTRSAAVF